MNKEIQIIFLLLGSGLFGCFMIWALADFKNPLKAKNYPDMAWLPIIYATPLLLCIPISLVLYILYLLNITI